MKRLLFQLVAATLGLWVASMFIPGVMVTVLPDSSFFGFPLTQMWELIILFGIILGLLNFFVKPLLKALTLPLEIITLGLFSFVINMGLIWVVDAMFKELYIPLYLPLLYTSLTIWGLGFVLSLLIRE